MNKLKQLFSCAVTNKITATTLIVIGAIFLLTSFWITLICVGVAMLLIAGLMSLVKFSLDFHTPLGK